jgi:hypothetical protein
MEKIWGEWFGYEEEIGAGELDIPKKKRSRWLAPTSFFETIR